MEGKRLRLELKVEETIAFYFCHMSGAFKPFQRFDLYCDEYVSPSSYAYGGCGILLKVRLNSAYHSLIDQGKIRLGDGWKYLYNFRRLLRQN